MAEINEEILKSQLNKIELALLTRLLVGLGYERADETEYLFKNRSEVLSRLVLDNRELGIENFVSRLSKQVITEVCSLLEFTSSNSTRDEDQLRQLEDYIKALAGLDEFFNTLTPHLLNQICVSLQIKIPNIPEHMHPSASHQQLPDRLPVILKAQTVSSSRPSVALSPEGHTIITRTVNRSSFKEFASGTKVLYGDGAPEGQLYETIIDNLKKEIILSGTESFLTLQDPQTLNELLSHFKITQPKLPSSNDKIALLIPYLFNLKSKTMSNNNNNDESVINDDDDDDDDDHITPYKVPQKKYPAQQQQASKITTTMANEEEDDDDSDIDKPASRPSISMIQPGITQDQLSKLNYKDLKSWLASKRLKNSGNRHELENIILGYFSTATPGSDSLDNEENPTDTTINSNNKRTKNFKEIMKSKRLKESRNDESSGDDNNQDK